MWKLTYDAPYGKRINRYWRVLQVCKTHPNQEDMWWDRKSNKWSTVRQESGTGYVCGKDPRPKSIKAFLRYLIKHPELKGYEVILRNRYYMPDYSYHVSAVWEETRDE